MYSGKSTMLLSRYRRYKLGNKKCILIKYANDNRYSESKVITHDNIGYDAIACEKLEEIDSNINKYDVICIDEIQFYSDAAFYCDKWANNGKIVEVCGLNGDYRRKPFEQISMLIPLVDSIIHLTAIDEENGMNAPFTKRITKEKTQYVIGGKEMYKASHRSTFN